MPTNIIAETLENLEETETEETTTEVETEETTTGVETEETTGEVETEETTGEVETEETTTEVETEETTTEVETEEATTEVEIETTTKEIEREEVIKEEKISKANPESDFKFLADSQTISDYRGKSTDVIIPSTIGGIEVLGIGSMAFERKGLTSVEIPNSVTTIGEVAFKTQRPQKEIPYKLKDEKYIIDIKEIDAKIDLDKITSVSANKSSVVFNKENGTFELDIEPKDGLTITYNYKVENSITNTDDANITLMKFKKEIETTTTSTTEATTTSTTEATTTAKAIESTTRQVTTEEKTETTTNDQNVIVAPIINNGGDNTTIVGNNNIITEDEEIARQAIENIALNFMEEPVIEEISEKMIENSINTGKDISEARKTEKPAFGFGSNNFSLIAGLLIILILLISAYILKKQIHFKGKKEKETEEITV